MSTPASSTTPVGLRYSAPSQASIATAQDRARGLLHIGQVAEFTAFQSTAAASLTGIAAALQRGNIPDADDVDTLRCDTLPTLREMLRIHQAPSHPGFAGDPDSFLTALKRLDTLVANRQSVSIRDVVALRDWIDALKPGLKRLTRSLPQQVRLFVPKFGATREPQPLVPQAARCPDEQRAFRTHLREHIEATERGRKGHSAQDLVRMFKAALSLERLRELVEAGGRPAGGRAARDGSSQPGATEKNGAIPESILLCAIDNAEKRGGDIDDVVEQLQVWAGATHPSKPLGRVSLETLASVSLVVLAAATGDPSHLVFPLGIAAGGAACIDSMKNVPWATLQHGNRFKQGVDDLTALWKEHRAVALLEHVKLNP